jgi:hypothetical protein
MEPIIDEHSVADPDPDERRPNRPAWVRAVLGAALLLICGYLALHALVFHKVIHCQCRGGEKQQVVDRWRDTDAACAALCARVD